MKKFPMATLGLAVWLAGAAADDKPPPRPNSIPAEWSGKITDAAQLPVERNHWGTLQWLCNSKLMPGANQAGLQRLRVIVQTPSDLPADINRAYNLGAMPTWSNRRIQRSCPTC